MKMMKDITTIKELEFNVLTNEKYFI